ARIISAVAPLTAPQWISSISIPNAYTWRNDKLVSLNDRFVYVDDPDFPRGRRPVMGYTALYRFRGTSSQLALITYALTPTDRPNLQRDDFAFIPPELSTTPEADRLVRLAGATGGNVNLGYDSEARQYFIEVGINDEDNLWVVEPGQILLMESSLDLDTGDISPGSDVPVRVVSVRQPRDDNGVLQDFLRGYLDQSPRVNGRSPLRDPEDSAARIDVRMWGLQNSVESLSDDTIWQINPVEVRLFQLRAS
ncbi:MAG: hypothetical protein VYC34_11835, partial [Planctomycetota bacterium]|nr:hypothetical protein [Planctomycetota bacterium]